MVGILQWTCDLVVYYMSARGLLVSIFTRACPFRSCIVLVLDDISCVKEFASLAVDPLGAHN